MCWIWHTLPTPAAFRTSKYTAAASIRCTAAGPGFQLLFTCGMASACGASACGSSVVCQLDTLYVCAQENINGFLAQGRPAWRQVQCRLHYCQIGVGQVICGRSNCVLQVVAVAW